MTPGRLAAMARRGQLPRRTVRLRLTLWYGGLFLAFGTALLGVTYALVVQAFVGNTAGNAFCQRPQLRCHAIGAQALALALRDHATVLHELLTRSAAALAVMTVLAVAFGWIIADRVLRPIRAITAAARQISATSLAERLALTGPDDEIRQLADTFDGLLARLEASFRAQRQFIANASHELRTPLARQRVISQVALADPAASADSLRAAHERVLASGAEQHQLIDALLTLAQGQAGLDTREPVNLADVTRQVAAARRTDAEHRNLTLHLKLSPAPAVGSPRLIEQLAANLVDNALRHNVPGGQVDITTQAISSHAVLSVSNTGPAVPADAVGQLFLPFQRLRTDRVSRSEGLGLGLSIAQAIADAHGASLTARPRPGGGLQVRATFPGAHPTRPLPDTPPRTPEAAAPAEPETTPRSNSSRWSALFWRQPAGKPYRTDGHS
jgi:signal transduction histidine kinase